jgi:O-antigen ligase
MATAQLTADPTGLSVHSVRARTRSAVLIPAAIATALLALILYAAFAHGAVSPSVDARIELIITGIAVAALVPWLWTGTLRLAAPRTAAVGVGLLGAFGLWSGITVLWSVAPDQTWLELNHIVTYILVLGLAMAIGSSHARGLDFVAVGFVWVALVVTAYALGQKLFPGLHVPGLFDLNQTGPLPRLQEPLGYWNALALFVAMAVPPALAVACDRARPRRTRIAALCAIELMLLTIVFTYSRGGLLALAIGLAVGIVISGDWLRSAMWLGVAVLATVPIAVLGLVSPQLSRAGEKLSSREFGGAILAILLVISLVALVAGARKLIGLEPRLRIDASRFRGLRRLGLAGAGVVVVGIVLALSVSSRGLTGTVSHAWHTFTTTQPASNYDPSRLLSADSQNRWVWWKEAAGAFSDRPLGGWGAGSFAVVHRLYRRDTLTVQQPHSVPLQFLSETGVVGALLAVGAFVLLLRAGVGSVRRREPGSQRLMAAGALAAGLAYAIHSLYDWDWEIPAVTLPALLLLGVLVSSRARVPGAPMRQRHPLGPRAAWLAAGTLWLGVFALSIELPNLAASQASAALVNASATSPAVLAQAQSDARTASALDPLSDAGLRAQATLAIHQGRLASGRTYLQQAVQRAPSDVQAWSQLAFVDVLLRDNAGARSAAQQAIALDPQSPNAINSVRSRLLSAPPEASATATPTPLSGP